MPDNNTTPSKPKEVATSYHTLPYQIAVSSIEIDDILALGRRLILASVRKDMCCELDRG